MNSTDIIRRIKEGITKKDPHAMVFLYGSRARGDNRIDSDWDVLVLTPQEKITFDYELSLRDPILEIELETGNVISLIVYPKSEWKNKKRFSPLFMNINKERIQI